MANTDQNTAKRPMVAKHEYLDASGAVVEDEESAVGYRYTLRGASDESFDWSWNEANDAERKMIALFGAKTLATNVTSAHRQKNGKDDYAGQIDAVQKRFKQIREGVWVERGEGGFAIKLDLLCQAINEYQKAEGKPLTDVGTLMQRLEEEDGFKEKVRKVPGVASAYAKLAGRQTATLDDLGL